MKIRLGMLVTDARGKAGGQYIRKFGSLHILQNITKPTYRLAGQQNKQIFINAYLFSTWRYLSASIRNEWAVVGSNISVADVFGTSRNLTARQAFLKYNMPLFGYLQDFVDPFTFNYDVPLLAVASVELEVATQELRFNITTASGAEYWEYRALLIASSAENPVFQQLRGIGFDNGSFGPQDLFNNLQNKFGTVTAGNWYMVSLRLFSGSGVASPAAMFKVQAF